MAHFSQQVDVPYSSDRMYALVNDIAAYPSFIPQCASTVVHEKSEHRLRATMTVAAGKLAFGFTTVNSMVPGRSIAMRLEKGPFRSMQGIWRFLPLETGRCIIALSIDFEFANRLLAAPMERLFAQLCDSMLRAFLQEAAARYGPCPKGVAIARA